MDTNTIESKKSFKIALYSTCPIYGKLKVKKDNQGYLKYYDKNGEIKGDLDNYNRLVVKSIIEQARTICTMKCAILWSY